MTLGKNCWNQENSTTQNMKHSSREKQLTGSGRPRPSTMSAKESSRLLSPGPSPYTRALWHTVSSSSCTPATGCRLIIAWRIVITMTKDDSAYVSASSMPGLHMTKYVGLLREGGTSESGHGRQLVQVGDGMPCPRIASRSMPATHVWPCNAVIKCNGATLSEDAIYRVSCPWPSILMTFLPRPNRLLSVLYRNVSLHSLTTLSIVFINSPFGGGISPALPGMGTS